MVILRSLLVAALSSAVLFMPALAGPSNCYHKINFDLSSCHTAKSVSITLPKFRDEDHKYLASHRKVAAWEMLATSNEMCIPFPSIKGRFFFSIGPSNDMGINVPSIVINFGPSNTSAFYYTVDQFGNALTNNLDRAVERSSMQLIDSKGNVLHSLDYPFAASQVASKKPAPIIKAEQSGVNVAIKLCHHP